MKYYKHVTSFLGKLLISVKRWKKAEEKFVNLSDKVVVVTKEAKKELLTRCNKKNNEIIVYPNTVRQSFYKNKIIDKKIKETYSNNFVMLYIGNTSKRRGLDTVLDSMNTIKKNVTNIKLVILGKSSYDYKLKKKINKLKLGSVVDFKGWIDESELYKYLLISDIGISPLYSNLHHDTTYANKLFQYMSFRVPIVCSDSQAQANLIKENNCGVVFKNNDANDFIRVLLELIKNKSKLKTLSKNCQIAIDKLDNNIVSKDLTNIYA
ncbi:MAG: glycosyltransferase [Bacteroidota bacterium]|nr:glycosyltransferase [Bacteroidota bacterium]